MPIRQPGRTVSVGKVNPILSIQAGIERLSPRHFDNDHGYIRDQLLRILPHARVAARSRPELLLQFGDLLAGTTGKRIVSVLDWEVRNGEGIENGKRIEPTMAQMAIRSTAYRAPQASMAVKGLPWVGPIRKRKKFNG